MTKSRVTYVRALEHVQERLEPAGSPSLERAIGRRAAITLIYGRAAGALVAMLCCQRFDKMHSGFGHIL